MEEVTFSWLIINHRQFLSFKPMDDLLVINHFNILKIMSS